MTLTDGQRIALRILAGGGPVADSDFMNIADVQALGGLGLAQPSRQGWTLTSAGSQALTDANRAEQALGEGYGDEVGGQAAELEGPGDDPDF